MLVTKKYLQATEYWNNLSALERNEIFQKVKLKSKGITAQYRNIMKHIEKNLLKGEK